MIGVVQGYDVIGVGNVFIYYIFCQDDLCMVNKLVEVYQYLVENGGMYIKMFLLQYMIYLKGLLSFKIVKYDEEIIKVKIFGNDVVKIVVENNKVEV